MAEVFTYRVKAWKLKGQTYTSLEKPDPDTTFAYSTDHAIHGALALLGIAHWNRTNTVIHSEGDAATAVCWNSNAHYVLKVNRIQEQDAETPLTLT
jgi:hypothetical protein